MKKFGKEKVVPVLYKVDEELEKEIRDFSLI